MGTTLRTRIDERTARIGVIGLGYVGLPLATAFAQAGFQVTGFDIDRVRVASLNSGICHIADVDAAVLRELVVHGAFRATDNFALLAEMDTISICVPTPLGKTKDPDISSVVEAAERIAAALRPGQLVVLESTTYPGTTDELVRPILERSGLRIDHDYWLAFSPERIDPGNQRFTIRNTPKVIGGVSAECTELAAALYGAIVERVVPVGSARAAEMVKLLENVFRAVNIALANELAQIADVLEVDVWEVIDAAATKPFGFLPFYPGPGLGGHCIPIDPHYLAWKLRTLDHRARFIELASEINGEMPRFVVGQVQRALNERATCLNGARILILGVAYKRDVADVRESPALDIIQLLREYGAQVVYADSHVPELHMGEDTLYALPLSDEVVEAADCVVIVTDHSDIDYAAIVRSAALVVDTRNATGDVVGPVEHVWRLMRPFHGRASESVAAEAPPAATPVASRLRSKKGSKLQ